MTESDPTLVAVAGDWHGNWMWARAVIEELADVLPADGPRLLLQAGDFGIWPGEGGRAYLQHVTEALAAADMRLWFVDGNHEDHAQLAALTSLLDVTRPVAITDRITWLPRGHRWTWHDRRWLALGGATSVDRPALVEGKNWWRGEAISGPQMARVIQGGLADVMLTHDAPWSVPMTLPEPPAWWDLQSAARHRALLERIVLQVHPQWLIHGHYHLDHEVTVQMPYGPLHVTGLDCDGSWRRHTRLLDVESMAWKT